MLDAIGYERTSLIGRGAAALLALYAGSLDDRVETVVCDGGLVSYRALIECGRPVHGANLIVRGVLLHFDLPDVAAIIAPRKLVLRGAVDGLGRPAPQAPVRELYGPAVRVVSPDLPYQACLELS